MIGRAVQAPSATASNQLNIGGWIKRDGTSEMTEITDPIVEHSGNVRTYYAGGYIANSTSYNWDITVPSEGGWGNSFWVVCGYNHYYASSYGAHHVAFYSTRGTSISSMGTVINQTSGNGGGWSVSKPNATTLRITKSAGTYGGAGYGFVKVVWTAF
jgi:hypothetical protein